MPAIPRPSTAPAPPRASASATGDARDFERFLTPSLHGFGTSIFSEVNQLALAHDAVNLGQGAPSWDGPEFIKEAAVEAIRAGYNQYARGPGALPLVEAIAEHQKRFYGLDYDPRDEVSVFVGATEAIFVSLMALARPGDEVVAFEPYYDSYPPAAAMAGATFKVVPLEGGDFSVRRRALEAAVTPRTRILLVNSPHNPTGKVFSDAELALVAEIARERDLLVVTDEVYEHIVFDGVHRPLASLPGMRERTVLISSTGKTFSLTGWKIGYACAPPALIAAMRAAHQFISFCQAHPLQRAMAVALRAEDAFFHRLVADYRARRDRLVDTLAEIGFGVTPPAGTYFVLADIRPLGYEDGAELCLRLPAEAGVAAIPMSAFCAEPERGRAWIRFAFCKDDELLAEGIRRLRSWAGG